jgi:hypothetical protein
MQDYDGCTNLDFATQKNHPEVVEFLTSASSLVTNDDYWASVPSAPPYSPTYLHDRQSSSLRPVLLSFADNRAPKTKGQVIRHILAFVGTDVVSSRTRSHS